VHPRTGSSCTRVALLASGRSDLQSRRPGRSAPRTTLGTRACTRLAAVPAPAAIEAFASAALPVPASAHSEDTTYCTKASGQSIGSSGSIADSSFGRHTGCWGLTPPPHTRPGRRSQLQLCTMNAAHRNGQVVGAVEGIADYGSAVPNPQQSHQLRLLGLAESGALLPSP